MQHIFSSYYAFAALKDNGSVVTWGYRDWGGDSNKVKDQLAGNVRDIFSTERAFAALNDNGYVVTWGGKEYSGPFTRPSVS